jgi:hypothetical protein
MDKIQKLSNCNIPSSQTFRTYLEILNLPNEPKYNYPPLAQCHPSDVFIGLIGTNTILVMGLDGTRYQE